MIKIIKRILIAISFCATLSKGCELNGYESGTCVESSSVQNTISFCKNYLNPYICVPLTRVVWPDYDLSARDQSIRSVFVKKI